MRQQHLFLFLFLLSSCNFEKLTTNGGHEDLNKLFLSSGKSLSTFESCEDLRTYINKALNQRRQYPLYAVTNDVATATSATGSSEKITNLQEAGVDESDTVKASTAQMFFVINNSIKVVKRSNWTQLGTLNFSELNNLSLYVDNNRLIVLGEKNNYYISEPQPVSSLPINENPQTNVGVSAVAQEDSDTYIPYTWNPKSYIAIYSLSNNGMPLLQHEETWDGSLRHSRLKDGILSLVLAEEIPINYNTETQNVEISGDKFLDTDCKNFYKPVTLDFSTSATKLVAINTRLDNPQASEPVVLMGFSEQLYASENNLYLTKSHYAAYSLTPVNSESEGDSDSNKSTIVKISWPSATHLEMNANSMTDVKGIIENRLWLSERNGKNLFVVTNDYTNQSHRLISLDTSLEEMKVLDTKSGFGEKEDIKAVRFVDNKVYVVTFRRIDPLYAFDISNPASIQTLGELKTPGFSSYLHAMGNNTLIGLGSNVPEDTNRPDGLKLSLFDIQNSEPTELNSLVIGGQPIWASSDAIYEPHAFFAEQTKNLVAFPVNEYSYEYINGEYSYKQQNYGAIYAIVSNTLRLVGKVFHSDLILSNQDTYKAVVSRIFLLDGKWISFSQLGIKVAPESNPTSASNVMRFE